MKRAAKRARDVTKDDDSCCKHCVKKLRKQTPSTDANPYLVVDEKKQAYLKLPGSDAPLMRVALQAASKIEFRSDASGVLYTLVTNSNGLVEQVFARNWLTDDSINKDVPVTDLKDFQMIL